MIKNILWLIVNALFLRNPLNLSSSIKVFLLRLFGADLGKNILIKPGINVKYPWKLKVGNWCWIGENVWIDNLVKVTLGDNVCISQGAFILTGNHNYKKMSFDLIMKEVIIGNGVWIGAKSMVTPGIVCVENAVLCAGSVATKKLEENGIYQGNPAVKIRERIMSH